jgi:hypothetical protein
MATIASGTVTASVPNGGIVTTLFTDTTTGISGLISKTLVITDTLGNVLQTTDMGVGTTATFPVTSDQWLRYTLTVVDNNGSSVAVVDYVVIAFYQSVFAPAVAALTNSTTCNLFGQTTNLANAELNKNAALDMALFSQPVQSNALIIYANFLVNTPYCA